ncbi:hypothetical protein ACIQI8_00480 [Streptomyces sp. NPDC092369]|uniref:hypothetical protein n=1 Tax=Streptomyces sp. NPDC092369 TaxID=3366015 RepID=UPI00380D8CD7
MKIWTEPPSTSDVEAVVRDYFSLLRAGRFSEAEQTMDHNPMRHVLTALWSGSVEANAEDDEDEASGGPAADAWKQDLSWLGELELADFHWGHTGSNGYVEITYRGQTIEVSLGFRVRPTDAGWVLTGPATYW